MWFVIQSDLYYPPLVGGHQQPLKASRFHHPKQVTKNFQVGKCIAIIKFLYFPKVPLTNS